MSCYICLRGHDAHKLPFLCPMDARNQIYSDRIKHAQLLVENEGLRSHINTLIGGAEAVDAGKAAQTLADDGTTQILESADRVRQQIRDAKEDIRQRRAALSTRRSQLAAASHGDSDRRSKDQRDVEKSTQMFNFRWSQSAEDMAVTRAFLCREAVKLYGLKRTRKGASGRYEYLLGRLPIIDLRDMEAQTPEAISTSLAHISHILMLIAHYLAVRLPAEITLPHRDYPRPTIFNLAGSYHHGRTSFPGTPSATTILNETQQTSSQHLPTPRPLYIDKPLRQFAKENSAAFSFFLEGVTLLAYNIAWLCCSQGVSIGDKSSFDDISNMGKNLHSLLVSSSLQGPTLANAANDDRPGTSNKDEVTPSWIGRYSHGTAFYALAGADGTELVRTFKLPSPMKLADKLKKKILGEASAPDWELLEDDAWKVDDAAGVEPGKELPANGSQPLKSESRGWMKVKSR
ncbi:UV radiation resistance protein/autophagy-related protein 14 [Cordyceps fumosorosea ARSEF 2679]|uniref:Autophagy-related protein 14 n=1 Tax=Cordyceps fumosorosea (strain ARSEF 2679) TaxID=1081104 RepID=A0A168AM08_CORFA|nr:UV radiation resistance protein/autophagy-related protein 14 [Cordyceps fumosorosea ARSEF 2679]OAA68927.1 UV radiation resistance protein/autophagy-related protein 14 [Cordyceps fumosorosea ARSEF 2679]